MSENTQQLDTKNLHSQEEFTLAYKCMHHLVYRDLKTRNSALSVVASHLKRVIQPIKKCLVIAYFVRSGELKVLIQSYAW